MLTLLRNAVFSVCYASSTVVYGALVPLLFWLPKLAVHRFIISWTFLVVWLAKTICGVRYEIKGDIEAIKRRGRPVVILAKHQSAWETFFLQGQFWPATTVLKKELLRLPFFGWGLAGLNPIAIDRSNPRLALKQVKSGSGDRLEANYNVILFPEGTRTPPGERGKYARSGADIAIAADVDIVPIAHNAATCWPSKAWIKHPGTITVVVGEPISVEGKNSKAVIAEVETWIEDQMAQI